MTGAMERVANYLNMGSAWYLKDTIHHELKIIEARQIRARGYFVFNDYVEVSHHVVICYSMSHSMTE